MNLIDGSKTANRVGLDPEHFRRLLVVLLSLLLLVIAAVVRHRPGLTIDVLSPIIVYLALEHGLMDGLGLAVVIGYIADVSSGEARGLTTSVAVLLFLGLRLFVSRIIGATPLMVTLMVLFGTALSLFLRLSIETTIGPDEASLSGVWPALPGLFGGAALFGYPVYRLLHAISTFVRPKAQYGFSGNRIRP
jgi:rod shape-determining protein MreD